MIYSMFVAILLDLRLFFNKNYYNRCRDRRPRLSVININYLPVKSKFEMRTHTVRPYGVCGDFVVKM